MLLDKIVNPNLMTSIDSLDTLITHLFTMLFYNFKSTYYVNLVTKSKLFQNFRNKCIKSQ